MVREWGTRQMHTGLWWGKLNDGGHMEDVCFRRGLGDNIVTDVREIGWEDVDGINVAQDGDRREGTGVGL